jgi:hypothetical protein
MRSEQYGLRNRADYGLHDGHRFRDDRLLHFCKTNAAKNDSDAYHGTPLVYAATKGDTKILELLLQNERL